MIFKIDRKTGQLRPTGQVLEIALASLHQICGDELISCGAGALAPRETQRNFTNAAIVSWGFSP